METVTKLEAAERQLKEAIWLFFHEHDTVSIHTLTAAAYQVLHDLAKDKKIVDLRNNPLIRKDKRKEWIHILHAAQNYFKHADKANETIFEFRPAMTQFFMIDAIYLYWQLTQSMFLKIGISGDPKEPIRVHLRPFEASGACRLRYETQE